MRCVCGTELVEQTDLVGGVEPLDPFNLKRAGVPMRVLMVSVFALAAVHPTLCGADRLRTNATTEWEIAPPHRDRGRFLGNLGELEVYQPLAVSRKFHVETWRSARAQAQDGAGGNVQALAVLQTDFEASGNASNTVLLIWDETSPNLTGVRITAVDEFGASIGDGIRVDGLGIDELPNTNTAFVGGIPAGRITFTVSGAGVPSDAEASITVLSEQPFADVANLSCVEGRVVNPDALCDLVVTWESNEPVPTSHTILVQSGTFQLATSTETGRRDGLLFINASPGTWEITNIGFLFNDEGAYRGGFIDTTCNLDCSTVKCTAPIDFTPSQFRYSTSEGVNDVFATWINPGNFDEVKVLLDGAEAVTLAGTASTVSLFDLDAGEHDFAVRGVCEDGTETTLTSSTLNVLSTTPHTNAVTEFSQEFLPGSNQMLLNWTAADRSDWIDVWRLRDDQLSFLGSLDTSFDAILINSSLETDLLAIQFFRDDATGCYGSELTFATPIGNSFIRGVCDGIGSIPQLGSAVFGLNWLFVPNTEIPPCAAACDLDADGRTDVGDMIFLLNFLFASGDLPVDWIDPLTPACSSAPSADCATPNPECPL